MDKTKYYLDKNGFFWVKFLYRKWQLQQYKFNQNKTTFKINFISDIPMKGHGNNCFETSSY